MPTPIETTPIEGTGTTAAATAEMVTISAEELRQLQSSRDRLATVDAERLRLAETLGTTTSDLVRAREDSARDLATANERAATLEGQILADRKAAVISGALVGTIFVNKHAAAMARESLENRCDAVRTDGKVVVTDKRTGKPADAAIREWLESEEAQHLISADGLGGSGSQGSKGTTPTPPANPDPAARMTASDALIARERDRLKATKAMGATHHGLAFRP